MAWVSPFFSAGCEFLYLKNGCISSLILNQRFYCLMLMGYTSPAVYWQGNSGTKAG